mmetsp:Transcript_87333/g.251849  ORF Transcript_87333/g.251849 Transcript_87333/m.251849 type:complete len:263 (-) Transcript_87333:274-1062(-)
MSRQRAPKSSKSAAVRFSSSRTSAASATALWRGTRTFSAGTISSKARVYVRRTSEAHAGTESSWRNCCTFDATWSHQACACESSCFSLPTHCTRRAFSACTPAVKRMILSRGKTSANVWRPPACNAGCSATARNADNDASTWPKCWSIRSCARSCLVRNRPIDFVHVARWLARLSRTAWAASRCTSNRSSTRAARTTTGRATSKRRRASAALPCKASSAGSSAPSPQEVSASRAAVSSSPKASSSTGAKPQTAADNVSLDAA